MTVGKTEEKHVAAGIEHYLKRLKHYTSFEIKEIVVSKYKNASPDQQQQEEAEKILSHLDNTDTLVLLDENGKEFTSRKFAAFLEQQMVQGTRQLIFLVGGAYGFSEKVYERANFKISLSKMTFPHQLVRLIFIEQLYRAFTIIRNEPYHHD